MRKAMLPVFLLGLSVNWADLRADSLAWFDTPLGTMEVCLYDQDKPKTVGNFVRLVKSGAYQNSFFHRCEPNFVVQGGGFAVADPTAFKLFTNYFYVPSFGSISNEFNTGQLYKNEFGTIAMAKVANNPHSATTQWFFNLTNNSANLDYQNGGFTVFGRVVRGEEVLHAFRRLELGGGIVDMTLWYGTGASVFSRLPVQYSGLTPPFYPDLFYFRIQLLEIQLSRNSRGEPEITWPSVARVLNYLEYSSSLQPPDWQVLKGVTGTGEKVTVTDSAALAEPARYYRVRIEL